MTVRGNQRTTQRIQVTAWWSPQPTVFSGPRFSTRRRRLGLPGDRSVQGDADSSCGEHGRRKPGLHRRIDVQGVFWIQGLVAGSSRSRASIRPETSLCGKVSFREPGSVEREIHRFPLPPFRGEGRTERHAQSAREAKRQRAVLLPHQFVAAGDRRKTREVDSSPPRVRLRPSCPSHRGDGGAGLRAETVELHPKLVSVSASPNGCGAVCRRLLSGIRWWWKSPRSYGPDRA